VADAIVGEHGWAGPVVPLAAGGQAELRGLAVQATWTRHGYCGEAPGVDEAVGFALTVGDLRLWHAGDTEYDAYLHRTYAGRFDVAFVPINGSGANLDAREAALLALQLGVALAVPIHVGLWSDDAYRYGGQEPWATPNPELFVRTCRQLGVATVEPVLAPGASLRLERRDGRVAVERGG
jgi:L-ascorbate metabolism protein UlaG (beta-lactamase superfamily)